MTRRHHDARRVDQLAERLRREARLLGDIADRIHDAHTHIADELAHLGWPRRGDSVNVSGSGAHLTGPERDAEISYRYTSIREDMRDQITALEGAYDDFCGHIKATGIIVHTARRTGLSSEERAALKVDQTRPSMCCDNQLGKHGVDEWGDPLCSMPGVKGGLCERHYMAWYRARQADGIDVRRDHEPAA